MKKLLTLTLVAAFTSALSTAAFAQKKKAADAAPAADAKKADAKPAETKAAGKAMPMNARVDAIDAATKTLTTKRKKDGVDIKHVVTDATEINNGDAAGKFEDIKVGDTVSGLRMKKSDTEYDVVKITKYGPRAAKAKKDAKADADAADPKAATAEGKKP